MCMCMCRRIYICMCRRMCMCKCRRIYRCMCMRTCMCAARAVHATRAVCCAESLPCAVLYLVLMLATPVQRAVGAVARFRLG